MSDIESRLQRSAFGNPLVYGLLNTKTVGLVKHHRLGSCVQLRLFGTLFGLYQLFLLDVVDAVAIEAEYTIEDGEENGHREDYQIGAAPEDGNGRHDACDQ